MLKNYFKIAIRSLLRQKGYTLINIIGLSVGLATAMLIFLFVYDELHYDTFFRESKNIYRVYLKANLGSTAINGAFTPAPMAAAIKADYPEVKVSARVDQQDNMVVSVDEKYYMLDHVLWADSGFFRIFDFPLMNGDPAKVLTEPRTVVLTESTARKIFGSTDPVNKTIKIENDTSFYRITAVMKDPPHNTHFAFDMILSFHSRGDASSSIWVSNSMATYILLPENYPYKQLEKKLGEMVVKYVGPQVKEFLGTTLEEFAAKGNTYGYYLQPLTDIHLNTEISHGMKPSNNRKYLYIFSIIGAFIVIIACINFTNLSTARSIKRAREVGLRKVLGSDRARLIGQFLAESILVSLFSLVIAIILLEFALPYINNALKLDLGFQAFGLGHVALALLILAVFIGILAGFYPAFMLSSFRPTTIFRDKLKSGSKGSILRSLLVIVQFFIAISILSGTMVVYSQLRFMQNKDLGFNKDKLLVIERAGILDKKLNTFLDEVRKFPEVVSITHSTSIPGFPNNNNGYRIEGRDAANTYLMTTTWTDPNFASTYHLKMAQGRFFSADMPSDSSAAVINETAVKKFDLKNPIGTRFMQPGPQGKFTYLTVIGVVKDFHYLSLHTAIDPYVFQMKPNGMTFGSITVKLGPGNLNKTLNKVEDLWKQFTNGQPMQYAFLDDRLMTLYQEERRTGGLALGFTILAVMIACLGLLGLISYSTVQRTKEIGVRKIMGASSRKIVVLLARESVRLIIISSVLAWPVAYYFLKGWLADFAYKIGLNPLVFIVTTLLIFALALFTIGYQALYAATRNPADALRYE